MKLFIHGLIIALCAMTFVTAQSGVSADYFSPGTLYVSIGPPDAAEGTLWQLAGEQDNSGNWIPEDSAWQLPETSVAMPPGRYALLCQPAPGWQTPSPQPVTISPGASLNLTTTLRTVPVYDSLEDIPDQFDVRHGDTLTLGLADGLDLKSFEEDPAVQREITVANGVFSYTPSTDERTQFTVTFDNASGATRVVSITPQPLLPSEHTVLSYAGNLPDPEGNAYLHVTEESLGVRAFNNVSQEVSKVIISGVTVAFEPGHPNNLWQRFAYVDAASPDHFQEMEIYADTLVIGGPLHLPQTMVTITAREIRFEDGDMPASLRTTPLKKSGLGNRNGTEGLPGGDIVLNVGAIVASDEVPRLIADGGQGQDPAKGRDGNAGASYSAWNVDGKSAIRVVQDTYWGLIKVASRTDGVGSGTCPGNGTNAVPDGVPGAGGPGGVVHAAFDLGSIASAQGGAPGLQGPTYQGGRPGTPRNAVHAYRKCNQNVAGDITGCDGWVITKTCSQTSWGANAVSPSGLAGSDGQVIDGQEALAWLHPNGLRPLLQYARDAYLNGHVQVVKDLLVPYDEALGAYTTAPDEVAVALTQLRQEVFMMLHRIDNHLDYFGNPAGWVPMLSFEITKKLFEDEVVAAGEILYLTYYLNERAESLQARSAAIARVQAELTREVDDFTEALEETRDTMENLELEAMAIDRERGQLEEALKAREDTLRFSAQWSAGLKKSFRIAGAVLPLVPVGQPAVGIAGQALTVASRYNEAPPEDLAVEFLESQIPAGVDAFLAESEGGASGDSEMRGLLGKAQLVSDGMHAATTVLKESRSWESDVDAELRILLANDPDAKGLVEQIQEFNIKKRFFAEALATATHNAQKLMNGIAQNYLALDSLGRESVEVNGRIDQEAFRYIKEMEQRAKDRLLKFQYYLAKAFEYRTLTPYTGNFQLQAMYDFFQNDLVDTPLPIDPDAQTPILGTQDRPNLIALYQGELRDITEAIVGYLIENPQEQELETTYRLSEEELAELNTPPFKVTINLVESGAVFDQTKENLRIFDIGIPDGSPGLRVTPVGNGRPANVTVILRHSGQSLISSGGETYKFNHYKTIENRPITWEVSYDAATENVSTSRPSPRSSSLLESLLGEDIEDLTLYSRPAAWADLVISKEVLSDSVDMKVEELTLSIQFDFFRKKQRQADLEISTVTDDMVSLASLVTVDSSDANGRRDGRGVFHRVYRAGELYRLQAPAVYGGYAFDKWTDRFGNALGRQPVYEGVLPNPVDSLSTVTKIRAMYSFAGSSGAGMFQRGDVNVDGAFNLADAIATLDFLFGSNVTELSCEKSADANDDGSINLADAIYLLSYLFADGTDPAPPFDACGRDPTEDTLTCIRYAECP